MTDTQIAVGLGIVVFVLSFPIALYRHGPDGNAEVPDADPLEWSGVNRRRRDAKRQNEQVKLIIAFMNTVSAAFLVTGILAPTVTNGSIGVPWAILATLIAFALHIFAHAILRAAWQSEE